MLKYNYGITNRSYCILGFASGRSGCKLHFVLWGKVVHKTLSSFVSILPNGERMDCILSYPSSMDGIYALSLRTPILET